MLDPAAAARVRLVALDVDGVLTDNALYLGAVDGVRTELKRFDVQDGLGVVLLRMAGLPVVLVSGRVSEATTLRALELRVDEVIQDRTASKLPAVAEVLARRGLGFAELCYMGDDLADVPVLRRAGVAIAPANAVAEAKAHAVHVTRARGGEGAVREALEALLRARGEWDALVTRYYRERGDDAA